MADIEIEIDGRVLKAKPHDTVMQVADAAGIYIPRFCYHKHLSIAANCRMCLVEVEKSPKPLPACATPVGPGMKIFTRSKKTIDAQRAVMEFLLINHPLDCPICDQGGECELQDLSMGYGASHSHYDECKRSVADKNLGPLIATEMTRCILCTRCVRFEDEVAGIRELGVVFRGEEEAVTTYIEHAIKSEVSGNIIDLCPVGALTSKPFRFTARAWELDQAPSISPHDCIGSNVNIHTRYGEVMRVVSRENPAINQTWLADRDRFSYTGLYHADRLEEPMIYLEGQWQAVLWQQAFERIASAIQSVIAEHGADKIGALASPHSTLEEFYLLQKIMRGLGSPHIDHRLRETDMADQASFAPMPGLGMTLAELAQCDAIVLIGSNIQKEQPMAALRVRQASLNGATILAINPVDYRFNFKVTDKQIVAPQYLVNALQNTDTVLKHLVGKQKVAILLGALVMHHPQASSLRYYAQKLADACGAILGVMTDGANSAGAWLTGAVPHRLAGGFPVNLPGLNAYEMLAKPRKAYVLLNVEPDLDCAHAAHAMAALKQANFVLALSPFRNAALEEYADVILPISAFTETSGTFVNAMGEWQSFTGVAKPYSHSRPAWKILRVLGNFLQLEGFGYESSESIRKEVKASVDKILLKPVASHFSFLSAEGPSVNSGEQLPAGKGLTRIGEIPIYAVDSLVRHAEPLQEAQILMEGEVDVIRIHPETANQLKLKSGDAAMARQDGKEVRMKVVVDERIAKDAAWIAGGIAQTCELGQLMGEVEVSAV